MTIHTRKKLKEMKAQGSMMDAFILEKLYNEIESIAQQKYNQKNTVFEKNATDLFNKFVQSASVLEGEILATIDSQGSDNKKELEKKLKELLSTIESLKESISQEVKTEKDTAIEKILSVLEEAKTNIEKYKGEKGDTGEKGTDGKDGSPDTPDQVVEKLNKASKIPQFVKNLQQELKNVQRQAKGGGKSGGGMGDVQHESKSVNAGSTSITTTYPIAANGNAILKVAYRNMIWHKDIDFTVGDNRKTLTLSSDAQAVLINSTTIEVTYIRG